MKYMGSKRRIATELFDFITQDSQIYGGNWVEPFMGGGNMLSAVPKSTLFGEWTRYGNEINKYVVACIEDYTKGWTVPYEEISEELYKDIHNDYKNNGNKYPDNLKGFVGICCSFGGRFFNGYARSNNGRNYTELGKRALNKDAVNLSDVIFSSDCYSKMKLPSPKDTIIYCDPPYSGTTKYSFNFDHNKFYDWARKKHNQGYAVYISEYNMPLDFECIHKIELSCQINNNSKDKDIRRVERLFKFKG